MGSQPLSDVSIVEISTMIAGPYAGQMLGDLGADVVKIEKPGTGELSRNLEPTVNDVCFYYLAANRNKRSLALDVTTEAGQEVFYDLVGESDVVIENFHPAFTEKYGLNYDDVRQHNDQIIYCSISAFGNTGPYRSYPGIDTTIQAMSGGMSMTRTEDTPSMRSGVPYHDVLAASNAVNGILLSLLERERTGEGQHLDISLLDIGIAALSTRAHYSFATGKPYPSFGRRHNYLAPEGVYDVSDGEVQLSAVTDRHWHRFCEAIDNLELDGDERFSTVNGRVTNAEQLEKELEEALGEWDVTSLVEALREVGVPAAPINDTVTVWDDPHVKARNMRQTIDHPQAGSVDVIGFPIKYSTIEQRFASHPPLLGEHTEEILANIGRDADEIAALDRQNVVGFDSHDE